MDVGILKQGTRGRGHDVGCHGSSPGNTNSDLARGKRQGSRGRYGTDRGFMRHQRRAAIFDGPDLAHGIHGLPAPTFLDDIKPNVALGPLRPKRGGNLVYKIRTSQGCSGEVPAIVFFDLPDPQDIARAIPFFNLPDRAVRQIRITAVYAVIRHLVEGSRQRHVLLRKFRCQLGNIEVAIYVRERVEIGIV